MMPIPQVVPHDSWAAHYDRVYELTFGAAYQRFTDVTLAEIERVVPPPLWVVDFGAGTGRLALPLTARGYEVMAVESSAGMLRCLAGKAGAERVSALKPGGRLLLDIPMRAAFWGMYKQEEGVTQDVEVRSLGGDLSGMRRGRGWWRRVGSG